MKPRRCESSIHTFRYRTICPEERCTAKANVLVCIHTVIMHEIYYKNIPSITDCFNHFLLNVALFSAQALSCENPQSSNYSYNYPVSGHSTSFCDRSSCGRFYYSCQIKRYPSTLKLSMVNAESLRMLLCLRNSLGNPVCEPLIWIILNILIIPKMENSTPT